MSSPSRNKGRNFEREVSALFRSHGWDRACPTPGSGAIRPWGAGDVPAWPADIAFVDPFCVEAKRDERIASSSRGWPGQSFVRRTIAEHSKLVDRLNSTVGGKRLYPVVVGRASFSELRWWVPERYFRMWIGAIHPKGDGWVELNTITFFEWTDLLRERTYPG